MSFAALGLQRDLKSTPTSHHISQSILEQQALMQADNVTPHVRSQSATLEECSTNIELSAPLQRMLVAWAQN